jgi:hypothetical protein
MNFWSWRLLNSIETKFYGKLRHHYSRKQTKHNLRLVRALYINIAARYGLTPRQLCKCLPLKLKIDDDMVLENNNLAIAFCRCGYCIEPLWDNMKINFSRSIIVMRSNYISSTTFIHEFGHYLRFLLPMVYFLHGKTQALNDINFISKSIMNSDFVFTKNTTPEDMMGISEEIMRKPEYLRRGAFTTEEEEIFAKTWEKYARNGEAPNKELEKLFKDFRKDVFKDMNNQSRKYEGDYFEDLQVSITPTIKKFLDGLIIGNGQRGMSFFSVICSFVLYTIAMLCIIYFVRIRIIG